MKVFSVVDSPTFYGLPLSHKTLNSVLPKLKTSPIHLYKLFEYNSISFQKVCRDRVQTKRSNSSHGQNRLQSVLFPTRNLTISFNCIILLRLLLIKLLVLWLPRCMHFDWFVPNSIFSYVVVQSLTSCLTLCNPMDCSTPGFPVPHHLPELAQTHVHWVGDAIQPSHPLLSPSPPAFSLSQHHGLFQRVSSSHQGTKILQLQLQHQSLQWIFRIDFL